MYIYKVEGAHFVQLGSVAQLVGSCSTRTGPGPRAPALSAGAVSDRHVLHPQLLGLTVQGLSDGFLYALIALGYTLVYGVLQLINFAHSEVFMSGGFAGYFVLRALIGSSTPHGASSVGLVVVGHRGGRSGRRGGRLPPRACRLPAPAAT